MVWSHSREEAGDLVEQPFEKYSKVCIILNNNRNNIIIRERGKNQNKNGKLHNFIF